MDDLLISGNNVACTAKFKVYLSSYFHMKDLSFLKYFLGIEIAQNSFGFYLCQRQYVPKIIYEADLLDSKLVITTLEPNHKLAHVIGKFYAHLKQYCRVIDKLIYLIIPRPYLTYTVHVLAHFMRSLRQDHWDTTFESYSFLKAILIRAFFFVLIPLFSWLFIGIHIGPVV